MPSSDSIHEINYSPMLKNIGKGARQTFQTIDTVLSVAVSYLVMVVTFVLYSLGASLFHMWDSAMRFGGRKQEIYETTDQDNSKLYMIRYVLWFKDTEKTNRFNIFINHYITSTDQYISNSCKSCGLILYGTLREDKENKEATVTTTLRRMWNSTLRYPEDSIKYIIKPNTTCWELVTTKKVEHNKSE